MQKQHRFLIGKNPLLHFFDKLADILCLVWISIIGVCFIFYILLFILVLLGTSVSLTSPNSTFPFAPPKGFQKQSKIKMLDLDEAQDINKSHIDLQKKIEEGIISVF